jgi:uncharacterized membrane protein
MSEATAERRYDHRRRALERAVHRSLLAGLLLSGFLLVVGLVIALTAHEGRGTGPPPPLAALIADALTGRGLAVLDLGLLILMATPAVRVAVLVVGWWMAGEKRFAVVAATVLALLAASFVLGLG